MSTSIFNNNTYKILISLIVASVIIALPIALYIDKFGFGYWEKHQNWAEMGSYFGGIITPILTFISIILILLQLKSVNKGLQEERNYRRNADANKEIDYFLEKLTSKITAQKKSKKQDLVLVSKDDIATKLNDNQCDLAKLWNCIYISLMPLDRKGSYGPQHKKAIIRIESILGAPTCRILDSYLRVYSGNKKGGEFHFY
jgi:uncharacterized membrane protein